MKNYTSILSSPADAAKLKEHKFAKVEKLINGSKIRVPYTYLPISEVQALLDEIFGVDGWETSNFQLKNIANEIVGQIELTVYFQQSDGSTRKITRTGVAATLIRQKTGAQITDLNEKIPNSLEMDSPHLLSDCIKAAAKQLGNLFGRNENRFDTADETDTANFVTALSEKDKVILQIQQAKSAEELMGIYNTNLSLKTQLLPALSQRKKELLTLQIAAENENV